MARIPLFGILSAALLFAVSARAISLQVSPNSTSSSNPVEADYSSTHLFVDEINGDSIPIYVFFNPGTTGIDEAEVFTNLDNRNQANVLSSGTVPNVEGTSGVPYGIIPPNGSYIVAGNTNCYYTAYPMSLISGGYQTVVYANKTGAYRLTARYHLSSDPPLTATGPNTWHYYNDFSSPGDAYNYDGYNGGTYNYRDAAIVVSPTKARSMVMYEANAMYVNANAEYPNGVAVLSDTDYTTRSTFDDFYGGPNATTGRPCTLNYLKSLGVNWMWLQPVHPVGVLGKLIPIPVRRHRSGAHIA